MDPFGFGPQERGTSILVAVLRFRRRGVEVEVIGTNESTASLLERLAMHDKPGAMDMAPGH
jgi:sulfate permease, SulP family